MHSNIYSRDEMRHALVWHRFVCYCVERMRKLSNSCPARASDQAAPWTIVLQPQRAGLWLEALAVRDALYEQLSSDAAPCDNSAGRPAVQNRSACARIATTTCAACRTHRSRDRDRTDAIRNSSV